MLNERTPLPRVAHTAQAKIQLDQIHVISRKLQDFNSESFTASLLGMTQLYKSFNGGDIGNKKRKKGDADGGPKLIDAIAFSECVAPFFNRVPVLEFRYVPAAVDASPAQLATPRATSTMQWTGVVPLGMVWVAAL